MRALDVFRAYQKAGRPLSLTELSQRADIPVSTCHAVMKLLAREGYLYFVSAREAYPTRLLWQIAEDIRRQDPLVEMLEGALTALRDEVDETAILGVQHGSEVVYLLVLETARAIRYSADVGARKPLHSSSIGKLMLASLPPAALDDWIKHHALKRITERTITSAAALRDDLAATRQRGYSVTRGENVSDVMALAAPLNVGGALLGVAVAGPMPRMAARESWIAKKLLQATRRMGRLRAA